MIRQYELLDKIRAYNDKADIALINRAYVFSMKAHGNQRRASGEPYLVHPLEVASLLADLHLDDASIAVGLLHDTLEDTLATYDEIRTLFGDEVADLTEGVTKLSKIEFNNKAVQQAENFRKLILAMSKDIRVLLIKLADRLHNMRTLHHIPKPEKRRRIAQETMDIYAPLADRIGVHNVKTELEELSFREINPEAYARIEKRKEYLRTQDDHIDRVELALREELDKAGINARVAGREKSVYSIHRKMLQKNLTFDQLTDIIAYRIIVDDKVSCYEVLGHIHNLYKAIPGRFKDYISAPKPNGYQSLHTSVIGPFGNRMEIQIRTFEMNEVANSGVAAHWLYKQKNADASPKDSGSYEWLNYLIETLQNTDDPEEFIENAKLDLFQDEVFVFSPKGDLVTLPVGATPLDFAYHIHSQVGNKCQAARVNGRIVPLRARLRNGDQVEIITNKSQQPTPGWREFVVSGKARAAINRYLRAQERDEQMRLGKEMLEKAARRESLSYTEKDLARAAAPLEVKDTDELYAALGQGRMFPRQVFDVLFPDRHATEPAEEDSDANVAQVPKVERRDTRIGIDGLTPGMAIHMAKCCNPLPGEDIVGIINTGRGVTIHVRGCKNLEALADQPERWLSVRWQKESLPDQSYQVRMLVTMVHEQGALSGFTTGLFNVGCNIVDLHIINRASDTYTLRCDVEVRDYEHFNTMMAALRNLKSVSSVERLTS